jgi:hypothetical protein
MAAHERLDWPVPHHADPVERPTVTAGELIEMAGEVERQAYDLQAYVTRLLGSAARLRLQAREMAAVERRNRRAS